MKTRLIVLSICFSQCFLYAQEFSTKLYLTDKNGKKDTLEVGYDANATNGMDAAFGEISYSSPIDSTKFQAFIIGQCWQCNDFLQNPYYLKKQIMKPSAHYVSEGAIPIIFPYESLPVTISWDKSLFMNTNRDCSVITDWLPGRWYDISSDWPVTFANMKDNSTIQFSEVNSLAVLETMKAGGYTNIKKGQNYPFKTVYMAFSNRLINAIYEIESDNQIQIYPVIVKNQLKIKNTSSLFIRTIKIQSLDGKIIKTLNGYDKDIDCSILIKGIYFLVFECNSNSVYRKFIKE
ncbi:MAG: T9SS type A sorting domain-containing protein [Paludibacter sp.]